MDIRDKYNRTIDYMRISVTDRCNLRCIYCMPGEGTWPIDQGRILSYREIVRVVRIAVGLGVRKVRITGGEPLVRANVPSLISSISAINGIEDTSLTTNGMLLKKHALALAHAGLKRVNVSLDSLIPERYRTITRGGNIHEVLEGIIEADRSGLHPIKINMIPLRGINDDEIEAFARLTMHTSFHVRFIECMPTGSHNLRNRSTSIPADEIKERVSNIAPLQPVKVRKSGPARYFRFAGAPGVIGFISSVTHHFCESCNRLRLTSEGKIRPCLFSEAEIDLGAALRGGATDKDIERLLRLSVENKPEGRPASSEVCSNHLRSMSRIGG